MDEMMKFLVVAGIIAFGIYRQFNKEKAKNSNQGESAPFPSYEPEKPDAFEIPEKPKRKGFTQPLPQEGVRTTSYRSNLDTLQAQQPIETEEESNEFTIHTAEEARRAIIWSEILQRKY